MSDAERLAVMANDIAGFFASEADRDVAVAAIAEHLEKFWTPRMRQKLTSSLATCGDSLVPLARAALQRLASRVAA